MIGNKDLAELPPGYVRGDDGSIWHPSHGVLLSEDEAWSNLEEETGLTSVKYQAIQQCVDFVKRLSECEGEPDYEEDSDSLWELVGQAKVFAAALGEGEE